MCRDSVAALGNKVVPPFWKTGGCKRAPGMNPRQMWVFFSFGLLLKIMLFAGLYPIYSFWRTVLDVLVDVLHSNGAAKTTVWIRIQTLRSMNHSCFNWLTDWTLFYVGRCCCFIVYVQLFHVFGTVTCCSAAFLARSHLKIRFWIQINYIDI